MANRTTIAVLTGLVVGTLMGAGAVQYATLTADILVARSSQIYRNQRSINEAKEQGLEDEGKTGIDLKWHSAAARTQARGASAKQAVSGCTRINDGAARAACLQDLIDQITSENE